MLPSAALTAAGLGILAATPLAAHAIIDVAFRIFGA